MNSTLTLPCSKFPKHAQLRVGAPAGVARDVIAVTTGGGILVYLDALQAVALGRWLAEEAEKLLRTALDAFPVTPEQSHIPPLNFCSPYKPVSLSACATGRPYPLTRLFLLAWHPCLFATLHF